MKNVMSKMFRFTAHFSSFIIIAVTVILYVIISSLQITGGVVKFFNDVTNIVWAAVMTLLTIVLHQIVMSSASDNALAHGVETTEYKMADELNGRIINKIGATYEDFIEFIRDLNEFEKRTTQMAFIQSLGKKTVGDLTKAELKAYKKLKPTVHDVTNFLKPCYAATGKNGKIQYDSSYSKSSNVGQRLTKVIFTLAMSFVTLGPALFSVSNFGLAVLNALTMCIGLLITFLKVFIPTYMELSRTIPNKVYNKGVLVNTYNEKRSIIKIDLQKMPDLTPVVPKEEPKNEAINEDPIQAV